MKTGMTAADDSDLSAILPDMLPRLWRFGLRLTSNKHDAEDLVQRACVRALERRHQLLPGTSALSWVFSIMYSVWLNEVRARQIRGRASMDWQDDTAESVADSSENNPEVELMHRQVINAVESLPEAQRAVMLLVAVEGFSYREAADVLDVPIGTVMSRLARARVAIGKIFGIQQESRNQAQAQQR